MKAKRAAIARISALRKARPAPISGLDALLIHQVSFYDDPVRFTQSVNALADELEARVQASQGVAPADAPRVVVSGCPMAVPNWKVHALVEAAGAVIVGEESCVGERGIRHQVEGTDGDRAQLLDALVARYAKTECAVFTPNPERADNVAAMSETLAADGVLHYALQFCQPYQIEAPLVERRIDGALPTLRVETDYGSGDTEQLRTRVEAFLEQIGA